MTFHASLKSLFTPSSLVIQRLHPVGQFHLLTISRIEGLRRIFYPMIKSTNPDACQACANHVSAPRRRHTNSQSQDWQWSHRQLQARAISYPAKEANRTSKSGNHQPQYLSNNFMRPLFANFPRRSLPSHWKLTSCQRKAYDHIYICPFVHGPTPPPLAPQWQAGPFMQLQCRSAK